MLATDSGAGIGVTMCRYRVFIISVGIGVKSLISILKAPGVSKLVMTLRTYARPVILGPVLYLLPDAAEALKTIGQIANPQPP